MLLGFSEDFSWVKLFFLLFAISFWSFQTYFGARLLYYFSDVSVRVVTPKHKNGNEKKEEEMEQGEKIMWQGKKDEANIMNERRRKMQKCIPEVLFFVPFGILFLGFLFCFLPFEENIFYRAIILTLLIVTPILLFVFVRKIKDQLYSFALNAINLFLRKIFRINKTNLFAMENFRLPEVQIEKLESFHDLNGLGKIIFQVSLAILVGAIIAFAILSVNFMQFAGAISIITFAFGCWIILAYSIDYRDKKSGVPLKVFLLGLVLLFSRFNNDHPLRVMDNRDSFLPIDNVASHFKKWIETKNGKYTSDTVLQINGKNYTPHNPYPVFFVCAEGGACRSGYWTSLVLSHLQDSMKNFREHVYCYSSVSGGTLGVCFFEAMNNFLLEDSVKHNKSAYMYFTNKFFSEDFLAPLTGRMVFPEVFHIFFPHTFTCLDRAVALENSWEQSWSDNIGGENPFAESFSSVVKNTHRAFFINGTWLEKGSRTIVSNVNVTDKEFNVAVNLRNVIGKEFNYSTAVLLSARFPYFSPAARIYSADTIWGHVVDGGYFENDGATTCFEIITAVKNSDYGKCIRSIVVSITNDPSKENNPLRFLNEAIEPPYGLLGVRGAHTECADITLEQYIYKINGEYIPFNLSLSGRDVEMNWYLSEKARGKAEKFWIDNSSVHIERIRDVLKNP